MIDKDCYVTGPNDACPFMEVVFDEDIDAVDAFEAGEVFGIPSADVADFMCAADNKIHSDKIRKLRRRMLLTLGLRERGE